MHRKWLKSLGLLVAVGGLLTAGALVYASRQAQAAVPYTAMAELSGARISNPRDLEMTFAAMGQAAEKDVAYRAERLQNLIRTDETTGWQHLASLLSRYISYGPMCQQEAVALERQQLALAQDAVNRFETTATREATRGTHDFAQR